VTGSTAKRVLAIDVGERRTGLAATDPTGTICVPLAILEHDGLDALPEALRPVIDEREPELVIVGIPYSYDGSLGPQAKKIVAFVERLRARYPDLNIETVDEAESTDVAHEQLKQAGIKAARRKGRTDALAALEILRRYLGW